MKDEFDDVVIDKVCSRCGIGTEHFWMFKTMENETVLCSDCILVTITKLLNKNLLSPTDIVNTALDNS